MPIPKGTPAPRRRLIVRTYNRIGPVPHPEKWAFVVGCGNSGTTLLKLLLGTHPDVRTMPREGQTHTSELKTPTSLGYPRQWALKPELFSMEDPDQRVNVRLLKQQWARHFNRPAARVLLDDTPTNAVRTHWLQRHFPPAYFIGIVRNGYAVAEGMRRREGHPLDVRAHQWARANEIMLEAFENLNHAMLVRYEDLARSPDETIREIFCFLALTALDFSVVDSEWTVHEETARIQNMNPKSFPALNEEDRHTIERVAGPLLDRLSYRFGE